MSSKLVKKLLQQTNRPLRSANDGTERDGQHRKRKFSTKAPPKEVVTKEDMLQSHIQSILRLDHKIQTSASNTAQKSYDRHSSDMKQRQKVASISKKIAAGVSNSRSSASNFASKRPEPTYDKLKARQQREEDYYEGVAKALKKSMKNKKQKCYPR